MALFNFVDQVGPAVPASYLNALDLVRQAVSAVANGNVTIAAPVSGTTITINGATAMAVNGAVTIAPVGSVALTLNAPANIEAMDINGSVTSGQSFGLSILAGTTSADYARCCVHLKSSSKGSFMAYSPSNGTLKAHQRGGRGGARTWLVLLLLAAGLASGAMNVHQYRQRQMILEVFKRYVIESLQAPAAPAEPADSGEIFDGPCDLSWTLCWQRT